MRPASIICRDCHRPAPVPAKGTIPLRCRACRDARAIHLSSAARRRRAGRPAPVLIRVDQRDLIATAETAANRAAAVQRAARRLDWSAIQTAYRSPA